MAERLLLDYRVARHSLGGIGQTTLDTLCDTGQLVRVKIGRRAFVTAQSLAEYVESLEGATDGPDAA